MASKMEKVQRYLRTEKKCTSELVMSRLIDKVIKYEDIWEDFCHWLETRDYYNEQAVVVDGYNAQAIVDLAPMLDGIGAFNFLVDLRDQPEKAREIIKEGFRVL